MVLVIALVIGSIKGGRHRLHDNPQLLVGRNHFERVRDFELAARGASVSSRRPERLRIGIEISTLYNLSLSNQTFMANGHFWLNWPATVQRWMEEAGITADQLISFPNNIVSYDFAITPARTSPRILADGSREQSYSFSGHFWSEAIDFHDFPFNKIIIPIRFEVAPEDFSLVGPRPVALIANPRQPDLLGSLIDIPGLQLLGGRLEPYVHVYRDDNSFSTNTSPDAFSQVLSVTLFRTHPIASIGQWLIPVLIVMMTVFVAPTISGRLSDIRIAIPSAALLTLVVLQQTYETNIPQLSYLTFLDLVYLWCYVVTGGLFILFVWSANQCAAIEEDAADRDARLGAITTRIRAIDRRFQILSLIGTVVTIVLALAL